jgi:EmrB/QacA subfamily drug resistance transporter
MSRGQKLVLVVSILASFVAFLDGAIVNVALPAIQRDLGGGLAAQQWIVDGYLLTLGSLILIAGSLSDLLGRKKVLTVGLLGFGVASLLCALSPNSGALIAFRALQGIAGALLVPSSLALIISNFSGPAQGKAVGLWTAWTGISFIVGPLLGGILVDTASWRWIFAINVVPIAITLYLLNRLGMVKDERSEAKVDFVGALLCALSLGGPVFALIEQPHYSWGNALIYGPLVVGGVLFASFLYYEKSVKQPMLPLSLFRNHNFSMGNVATLTIYAGLTASTFLLVLFLQQVGGYSALLAGLSLLPVTIIMFLLSPRFGALAGRYGPRLFMGVGPLIGATGFLLMLGLNPQFTHGSSAYPSFNYWSQLFPAIIVFGIGLSVTVAPLTAAILGDVPAEKAGVASAVNNAVARVAGLVAVAAVGAIVAAQFGASLSRSGLFEISGQIKTLQQVPFRTSVPKPWEEGFEDRQALVAASDSAFHAGIATVSGLLIVGGVVSLAGIRNPALAPKS